MKQSCLVTVLLAILLSGCGAPAAPATVPPTAAPATATPTSAPTTAPLIPTATSVPPTATNIPPTATVVPPTATALPLTATLPASPTPPRLTPTVAAKVLNVTIKNYEFVPRDIKIAVGTTVKWVVQEGQHTTTSDDFRTKGPNAWHSGNLSAGQEYSFTFHNAGAFRFFCGFHSEPGAPLTVGNMNGLVTVSAQ